MDKNYIRIICLEFKNIKNVPYGKVDYPIEEDIEHNGRNNAFGIYGPNGSGKTALINMLSILRCIILGINPNSLSPLYWSMLLMMKASPSPSMNLTLAYSNIY